MKNKALLIYGPPNTGKTNLSKELANDYGQFPCFLKCVQVYSYLKHLQKFAFAIVDSRCDVIVIDDVPNDVNWEVFYNAISEGITIERRGRKPIHKMVKFIFVQSTYPAMSYGEQSPSSFLSRFDLRQCKSEYIPPNEKYPGWEYQPLFDILSDHGLIATIDDMDEIITASAKVMDTQMEILIEDGLGGPIQEGEINL